MRYMRYRFFWHSDIEDLLSEFPEMELSWSDTFGHLDLDRKIELFDFLLYIPPPLKVSL